MRIPRSVRRPPRSIEQLGPSAKEAIPALTDAQKDSVQAVAQAAGRA